MNNNLTKEEFINWTKNELEKLFPDLVIKADTFLMPNRSYYGITVHEDKKDGEMVAPIINLDAVYADYDEGMPLGEIRDKLISIVKNPAPVYNVDGFHNYEYVKDKLFIRVCGYEKNKEMLQRVPHKRVADLAITYHVLVKRDEEGTATSIIPNSLLDAYGITAEQLDEDATANSVKLMPARAASLILTLLNDMAGQPLSEIPEHLKDVTLLNNSDGIYGASVMFYPGVLALLAERFGGDLVILPSSIHESIIMLADEAEYDRLRKMVACINATEVPEEDRLTDSIYLYRAATDTIELIEKSATGEDVA